MGPAPKTAHTRRNSGVRADTAVVREQGVYVLPSIEGGAFELELLFMGDVWLAGRCSS